MAENFCYNQNGINHILEQFGDAISNKNRIPYDIYRKIKNGCQLIFISFDSGDVLVKNNSTTLFHTSYKDNRGHFFITSGLSFADNFGEAAAILESTYGEMLKSIKNLKFVHDDQNVITLPRDIIRDYIDGEKFINEIPCDSEGRELATLNQNASKANDNW